MPFGLMEACNGHSPSPAPDEFVVARKKRGPKAPSKGSVDQVQKAPKTKSIKSAPKMAVSNADLPLVVEVEVNGGAEPSSAYPCGRLSSSPPTSLPHGIPCPSPKLQPWQQKMQRMAEEVPTLSLPPWEESLKHNTSPSRCQSPSQSTSRLTPSGKRSNQGRRRQSPPLISTTTTTQNPLSFTQGKVNQNQSQNQSHNMNLNLHELKAGQREDVAYDWAIAPDACHPAKQAKPNCQTPEEVLHALLTKSFRNGPMNGEGICWDVQSCALILKYLTTLPAPNVALVLEFTLQHWGDVLGCLTSAVDEPSLDIFLFANGMLQCIQQLPAKEVLAMMGAVNGSFSLRQILTLLGDPHGIQAVTAMLQRGATAKDDVVHAAPWAQAVTRFFDNVVDQLFFLCSDYATSGPCTVVQFLQALHDGLPSSPQALLEAELQQCYLPVALLPNPGSLTS
eukprot:GGOE01019673.1.p1 GENE.GGOE01019673.1~~GGOE01019673.1.p1  ORF type:complete len:450 (-),score=68.60 GGOE01019673.1:600-1949(-)